MKIIYTTLFILISTFCIFGQRKAPAKTPVTACSRLIEKTTDKMTDYTSIGSKNALRVGNTYSGFNIEFIKSNGGIIFFRLIEGDRKVCIDDAPKIIILFTDGTKITKKTNDKSDCDGLVALGVDTTDTELTNKMIETIRIYTREGSIEADFTPLQARTFRTTLNCLFSYGK
jgi:hypothetical protein